MVENNGGDTAKSKQQDLRKTGQQITFTQRRALELARKKTTDDAQTLKVKERHEG
jgi:hypothetical protein